MPSISRSNIPSNSGSKGYVQTFTPYASGTVVLYRARGHSNTAQYVNLYDNTSQAGQPIDVVKVAADSNFTFDYGDRGIKLTSGITLASSTAPTGSLSGSADISLIVQYL